MIFGKIADNAKASEFSHLSQITSVLNVIDYLFKNESIIKGFYIVIDVKTLSMPFIVKFQPMLMKKLIYYVRVSKQIFFSFSFFFINNIN